LKLINSPEILIDDYLPEEFHDIENSQTAIPAIAKNEKSLALIEAAVKTIPTHHELTCSDAREIRLERESVHLVLTSPLYWTLKEYRSTEGQMGHIEDYEAFLGQLDRVWQRCYEALVPGGRLVCVVGDVDSMDMFTSAEVTVHG